MTKSEILRRLVDPGIIAIIRADASDQLVEAAGALLAGGVAVMEVTMTTPNALEVITAVTRKFGDAILMGVGTVIDPETARAAVAAGAEFIVTPVTKPEIIAAARQLDKPIASGAFTPHRMSARARKRLGFRQTLSRRNRWPPLYKKPPRTAPDVAHHAHRRRDARDRWRLPRRRQRRARRRLRPGLKGDFTKPRLAETDPAGPRFCRSRPKVSELAGTMPFKSDRPSLRDCPQFDKTGITTESVGY